MKTPKRTPLTFEPGEKVVFLGIDEAAVRAHVEPAEIPSSCTLEGDDRSLCPQVRDTAAREGLKSSHTSAAFSSGMIFRSLPDAPHTSGVPETMEIRSSLWRRMDCFSSHCT